MPHEKFRTQLPKRSVILRGGQLEYKDYYTPDSWGGGRGVLPHAEAMNLGWGEASLQEHGVIRLPVDRWEHREMRIAKGDL